MFKEENYPVLMASDVLGSIWSIGNIPNACFNLGLVERSGEISSMRHLVMATAKN